jgi:hypothetical protein
LPPSRSFSSLPPSVKSYTNFFMGSASCQRFVHGRADTAREQAVDPDPARRY